MRLAASAVFVAILATWGFSPVSAQDKSKPAAPAQENTKPAAAAKEKTKPSGAADAKAVELGQTIYGREKCSMCHSVAGKGNAKGPLDEVGSKLSEEEIRQWLVNTRVMTEKTKSNRKPAMPAYTKLTKDEVDGLVAYMKSLKKK